MEKTIYPHSLRFLKSLIQPPALQAFIKQYQGHWPWIFKLYVFSSDLFVTPLWVEPAFFALQYKFAWRKYLSHISSTVVQIFTEHTGESPFIFYYHSSLGPEGTCSTVWTIRDILLVWLCSYLSGSRIWQENGALECCQIQPGFKTSLQHLTPATSREFKMLLKWWHYILMIE